MKKILSLLLSATLLISLSISATAEGVTNSSYVSSPEEHLEI